jgi:aspartate kinase
MVAPACKGEPAGHRLKKASGLSANTPSQRLVLKFGGTSMADPARIARSAAIAASEAHAGKALAVVVSAMAGETDRLLGCAEALGGGLGEVETDTVLAAGEQASAALMALALKREGLKAEAVMAWSLPIHVEGPPGAARITAIAGEGLEAMVSAGVIPVVAGYQGLSPQGRLATLGRGGTDLTAVAVAAALKAECDIYTDVDGVFTTDPRIEPGARRVERISHDAMLELAAMGAKVLQTRSVEYAKAKGVTLRVKSSFLEPGASAGTEVVEDAAIAERRVVSGVSYVRDQARLSIHGGDDAAPAEALFAGLAEAGVAVDMIVQARARWWWLKACRAQISPCAVKPGLQRCRSWVQAFAAGPTWRARCMAFWRAGGSRCAWWPQAKSRSPLWWKATCWNGRCAPSMAPTVLAPIQGPVRKTSWTSRLD